MNTEDRAVLKQILETMDVPPVRIGDIPWLARNLAIRNWQHPRFKEAEDLIVKIIRSERN